MKIGTDIWCQVKSSDNVGGKEFTKCHRCCLFCSDSPTCEFKTCESKEKDDLCCWQSNPTEWMMGRLDRQAKMFAYQRRRREFWLRQGYRPKDGTWEGERLAEWWIRYPDVYREMLADVFEDEALRYETME